MASAAPPDIWASGSPYDRYVGRWSRLVAEPFLRWLSAPASQVWLDVGCGTGALTGAILAGAPQAVFGVEPSDGFRAQARESLGDKVTLLPGDAARIGLPDACVDIVVSGLVLNFVPDVRQALAEMTRCARTGGIVAAYVWDYAEGMELMRHFWDAAAMRDPAARSLDESVRFPLCRPPALASAFAQAGLGEIDVAPLTVATTFTNFEDYWEPFLGGQGPAPTYACSLDERSRNALRETLRQRLPADGNGAIRLKARAWAVRGFKRVAQPDRA